MAAWRRGGVGAGQCEVRLAVRPVAASHARRPLLRCAITGRVVLINYGADEGKLATIVDVVDGNRVCVARC
jgi:hypothetical protein